MIGSDSVSAHATPGESSLWSVFVIAFTVTEGLLCWEHFFSASLDPPVCAVQSSVSTKTENKPNKRVKTCPGSPV